MLKKKCPSCGSVDVRRSEFEDQEEQYLFFLKSPYRCKECGLRFWVVSRKVRRLIIWTVVLLVLMVVWATVALLIPGEMPQAPKSPAVAAAAF